MPKTKRPSATVRPMLQKPMLKTGEVLGSTKRRRTPVAAGLSGQVPEGDVRLTANIRADLHLKLKIRAAEQRTTVGELIEQWIEGWKR